MLSASFHQRLKDLEDHIAEEQKLLKDLEEELRYETDPLVMGKYRRRIERLRESLAKYKQEYAELQQELAGTPNAQMQNVESQLQQMDAKLNVIDIPVTGFQASDVGADYTILRNLLLDKKFEEADEETFRIMLWVANREKEGWLEEKTILDFPCKDLHTINKLWVTASNGRFGFSIQNQIFKKLIDTNKKNEHLIVISSSFFDELKWSNYFFEERMKENHSVDLRRPRGYLPRFALKNQTSPKKIQKEKENQKLMDYVKRNTTTKNYFEARQNRNSILFLLLVMCIIYFRGEQEIEVEIDLPDGVQETIRRVWVYQNLIFERMSRCSHHILQSKL